jgi:hypothetical protein
MDQTIISNTNHNWPNLKINYHKPIDLYVDSLQNFTHNQNYKILWVKEVEEISNFKTTALSNYKNFDLILTYDQEILNTCENAVMFGEAYSFVYGMEKSLNQQRRADSLAALKAEYGVS